MHNTLTQAEIDAISIDYEMNFPKCTTYNNHNIEVLQLDNNKFIANIYDSETFAAVDYNESEYDLPEQALTAAKKFLTK